MAENNYLPKFKSLEELTDFFDQNAASDYLEQMPEADFQKSQLKKTKFFVAVDEEILNKLAEISKPEHQLSETIVNSWLREKISGYSEKI